jgi:D-arabinan exo alpha-(1,3)/(1,5)-arabinofuranosidase (non-reducing end)
LPQRLTQSLVHRRAKDLAYLFYDIDFEAVARLPKDALYFHGYWNRRLNTTLGKDFEILPWVKGRGRFLGVNLGVIANPAYDSSWWGEGEVKMFLDGDDAHPTLAGTGTEDYTGSAWGLGRFAQRYQGCPVANITNRMWSLYRFHIPDPIFFDKALKVTIQTIGGTGRDKVREYLQKGFPVKPVSVDIKGKLVRLLEPNAPKITDASFPEGWVNFYREDDYCTTAYFYLDQPSDALPPLPPVDVRTAKLK